MYSQLRAGLLLLLLPILAAPAAAQQQSPAGQAEINERLLKRIEELEARIRQLEQTQSPPRATAPPETKPPETAPLNGAESVALPPSSGVLAGMQIRGFSDVGYRASTARGSTQSFALGQFDLFLTSRLSDTVSVLGEIVLEAGEDNELGIDLERVLLQYAPNDYFKIGVGRYHTAIGYYNTAYHHGTWFQTATGRPFLFAFEDDGGILPVHNVGLTAGGRIPSGPLGLQYVAEYGNGRTSRSLLGSRVQNALDENNGKSVNLGLLAQPKRWPGFQGGVSVYRDRLTPDGLPRVRQLILAGHVVYHNPRFEFLNEALLIRHALAEGQGLLRTPAFYTQVSRRFGALRPYLRYQYLNAPERDPIHGDVGRRNGPSAGVRYDFSEFAALKLQYDRTARRARPGENGLMLQVAFAF